MGKSETVEISKRNLQKTRKDKLVSAYLALQTAYVALQGEAEDLRNKEFDLLDQRRSLNTIIEKDAEKYGNLEDKHNKLANLVVNLKSKIRDLDAKVVELERNLSREEERVTSRDAKISDIQKMLTVYGEDKYPGSFFSEVYEEYGTSAILATPEPDTAEKRFLHLLLEFIGGRKQF